MSAGSSCCRLSACSMVGSSATPLAKAEARTCRRSEASERRHGRVLSDGRVGEEARRCCGLGLVRVRQNLGLFVPRKLHELGQQRTRSLQLKGARKQGHEAVVSFHAVEAALWRACEALGAVARYRARARIGGQTPFPTELVRLAAGLSRRPDGRAAAPCTRAQSPPCPGTARAHGTARAAPRAPPRRGRGRRRLMVERSCLDGCRDGLERLRQASARLGPHC